MNQLSTKEKYALAGVAIGLIGVVAWLLLKKPSSTSSTSSTGSTTGISSSQQWTSETPTTLTGFASSVPVINARAPGLGNSISSYSSNGTNPGGVMIPAGNDQANEGLV